MNFKKITLIFCCALALGMVDAQQSQTFNYTGSQQTWTVPCGVSAVTLSCYGAQGGQNGNGFAGRLGGMAQGVLTVTPGETLYIYVGQNGLNGGWNGGGLGGGIWPMYGGGASDVRVGGISLNDRVIVAGGAGCNAGYSDGWGNWPGGAGGAGGGYTGTAGGGNNGNGNQPGGGGGGTPSAGGATGFNSSPPSQPGSAGSFGQGGQGAGETGNSGPCGNAGGGGGGWYGGGGGGYANCGGGGGGGGSSYTGGVSNGTTTPGVQTGDGQVTITWNAGNSPLIVTGNVIDNVLCNGASNGVASGIVSGGGSPYTYSWTPVVGNKDTASGLSAGNYTITVSDACGNTATVSVSIIQPTALNVSASVVSNVLCNGENNGKTSSNVSGGMSPYTYSWSNGGGSSANATGLSIGTYSITVIDNNGCTGTASVAITQPNVLSLSAGATANAMCNGENNGSASSAVSGGTGPYTYSWSNSGTTDN